MFEAESKVELPLKPRISVVIISRNEGQELNATVTNLLDTLPPDQRELIVVDDGSTDGSTDFLAQLAEARVFRSDGVGVARARNFGGSHASGDIVLFSDAHMRTPPGWHEPIIEALRPPSVGAVAPGVYSLNEPKCKGFGLYLSGPDLKAQWRNRQGRKPSPVPILPGCFLAMRRETFIRTGGFDPGMRQLGGNDNEISCRFWLLGYELMVVPEVEVGHLFRKVTPYEACWAALVHNRVRMALIHFCASRVERVVNALRAYNAFPAAMAMMLESDVFARRAMITGMRRFDDAWYCDKFALNC
ncbi:MAG TPA: glycosyltransferase [Bryobacteraceae bacterium]|nr:glycosyltransferase [Bryobacteraceae bacterium]